MEFQFLVHWTLLTWNDIIGHPRSPTIGALRNVCRHYPYLTYGHCECKQQCVTDIYSTFTFKHLNEVNGIACASRITDINILSHGTVVEIYRDLYKAFWR